MKSAQLHRYIDYNKFKIKFILLFSLKSRFSPGTNCSKSNSSEIPRPTEMSLVRRCTQEMIDGTQLTVHMHTKSQRLCTTPNYSSGVVMMVWSDEDDDDDDGGVWWERKWQSRPMLGARGRSSGEAAGGCNCITAPPRLQPQTRVCTSSTATE